MTEALMTFKAAALAFMLMIPAAACSAQTCNNPAASLDQAVSKTQGAIRGNDVNGFLSLIGSQGVSLGSEGPQMSRPELEAELKSKSGVYCDLFSCNGRAGRLKTLMSASGAVKRINVARNGNTFAIVTLNRGHATLETELHYALVNCRWELIAIGTL